MVINQFSEEELADELERRGVINPKPDLFKDFTDDQLERELKRKEWVRKRTEEAPEMICSEDINLTALRIQVISYMSCIKEDGYISDNRKQQVFEIAMAMFYGSDVFEWVNKYNLE